MEPIEIFTEANFYTLCNRLAKKDKALQQVITTYGYPPVWTRPNTFESLVLIILEQQVSLASAYAAYKKLKEKIKISPKNLLKLTDEELRSCYFSRQKIVYTRELATAILSKKINLQKFKKEPDGVIRKELKALKGIGDWTVDIYLIHSLQRADIFPIGDLALVNGLRMMLGSPELEKEAIMGMAENWRPYRTIATMITWHYYIKKKNINLLH